MVELLHLDKTGPVLNFFLCLIDKVNDFSPSVIQSGTSSIKRKETTSGYVVFLRH